MRKIGSLIVCKTEIESDGSKWVWKGELKKNSTISQDIFRIIGYDEDSQEYVILLPDDYVGYTIGRFHVLYSNFPVQYENKKFLHITEDLILEEESKIVEDRNQRVKKASVK